MGPSLSSISSILLVPSIISPVAKYFEKLNFISGLFGNEHDNVYHWNPLLEYQC